MWDADARTATCLGCAGARAGSRARRGAGESTPPAGAGSRPTGGGAGDSARREYERLHDRRSSQIDDRFGRLAGVVRFLFDDPQSTRAWLVGSEGERRLARSLEARVGDSAVLLHDRRIPRSRANIDHLAVAASGVWVVDAKAYAGRVERRDKGGLFNVDDRLYVGGRDRTRLVDGMARQVDAVRGALAGLDAPVRAALCFVDADWGLFARPFRLRDVVVASGARLAELIGEPGPLTHARVLEVADRLAAALPPAVGDP